MGRMNFAILSRWKLVKAFNTTGDIYILISFVSIIISGYRIDWHILHMISNYQTHLISIMLLSMLLSWWSYCLFIYFFIINVAPVISSESIYYTNHLWMKQLTWLHSWIRWSSSSFWPGYKIRYSVPILVRQDPLREAMLISNSNYFM